MHADGCLAAPAFLIEHGNDFGCHWLSLSALKAQFDSDATLCAVEARINMFQIFMNLNFKITKRRPWKTMA
jgi:hypothetical protein